MSRLIKSNSLLVELENDPPEVSLPGRRVRVYFPLLRDECNKGTRLCIGNDKSSKEASEETDWAIEFCFF